MHLAPSGKNTKKSLPKPMCFSVESCFRGALACTGAPRPLPTPQPAHNTKVSRDLASSEVTRIAATSAFLEFAAGATAATAGTQVVARPAVRTPHPTRAGGQDDGTVVTLTPSNYMYMYVINCGGWAKTSSNLN